jgi:ribose transport system substrate-binding protein
LESVFQATRARELGEFAQEYGVPYRAYDSDGDPYVQTTVIERARLDGAKAFILCPLDADLLRPTLEDLAEANIPVVFVTLFEPGYGVMLDSDNYTTGSAAGRLAGEIIRDEHGGSADVVVLGYPGFPSSEQRAQGMIDGVREIAPDASLVGVYRGFTRAFGYESIRQLLADGVNIDVIVSMTDAGSFGAIDALEEAGIEPDEVAIVSANAEPMALDYIRDGNFIRGSVYVDRALGSRIALDAAIRLLAGGTVPETIVFPPGHMITADTLAAASRATRQP